MSKITDTMRVNFISNYDLTFEKGLPEDDGYELEHFLGSIPINDGGCVSLRDLIDEMMAKKRNR